MKEKIIKPGIVKRVVEKLEGTKIRRYKNQHWR